MITSNKKSGSVASLSLRTVFLIAVLLGVLIPALLIGTLRLNLQRDSAFAELSSYQRRILDILALGMEEPLWNLSRQSAVPLIKSVMDDPRVVSVQVTDSQTNTDFIAATRSERRMGSVSILQTPVVYRGEAIGQVTIEFDTEHLATQLNEDMQRMLVMLVGQILLSMLLIMVIVHSRFLRPVRELTHQATQLAELKLDRQFSWDRGDEIGRLGRHLEWTRAELKRLLDELCAKTMALEADIARRHEMEQALRRSENKYRGLFWSNLDGIVICSLEGQVLDANPAFLHLLSYTLDELKQQDFWSLVAAESQALERFNLDNKVMRFGYCDEFEAFYLNQQQQSIPVNVKIIAMKDASGTLTAVWRIVRDITERRSAEERMQLAAKVFETTTEGIMITDAAQGIRSVNRAFSTITGYSLSEVLGQKPNLLSSGRHDPAFFAQMWQQLNSRGFWQGELWNRRKNGEVYPEWLAIDAVKNSLNEVTHYVAIFSDQTERRAANERIEFLAHFDVLTGLPNRVHMQDRTELAIQNAQRDHCYLGVLLLDLDRFKTINESLGHAAGDALLQVVAERIKACLSPGQIVGRQGGDEFIILLPAMADPAEAALLAERIIEVVAAPVALQSHAIAVTTSIGISIYPEDGHDFDILARNADAAMYHAKSFGRNSFKFYTADLNAKAYELLEIESQLRSAFERNEFELYYQPLVAMHSGQITGAEALIRWNHPVLGLLGPNRFIPVAEERGFIVQLGHWVIAEACRQQARWLAAGFLPITVAVNLSALQFKQPDLVGTLERELAANGLTGQALDLEVTESMVMDDLDITLQQIDALKEMGLQLSIDDFGTGYSSLAYLKRFKADKLKIDRSFVQDIPANLDDAKISKAIINIAHALNMKVVAEGVETPAQWDFLLQQGCDLAQGYLLAKPLPTAAFTELLGQGVVLPPSSSAS